MRKVAQAELDERAELATEAAAEAKAMRELAETDWYVMRQIEEGTAIPAEVTAKRQSARTAASEARGKRAQIESRGVGRGGRG